ncbi:hypothetical protein [uncultured Roseibium sp.]|uniref:hypothetical protein n=1 Tax=uncultured Roseibium sp. TaxID=1936171 RepID=UPI0032176874
MRFLAALFGFFALFSSANAQTAEETVLYLMTGVEDGNKYRNMTQFGCSIAEKAGDNSVIVNIHQFECKEPADIKFKIILNNVDKCDIEITIEQSSASNDKVSSANILVNMSKLRGIDYLDGRGLVRFVGSKITCEESNGGEICSQMEDEFIFINSGEKDRTMNAFNYYREKYCSGSAF